MNAPVMDHFPAANQLPADSFADYDAVAAAERIVGMEQQSHDLGATALGAITEEEIAAFAAAFDSTDLDTVDAGFESQLSDFDREFLGANGMTGRAMTEEERAQVDANETAARAWAVRDNDEAATAEAHQQQQMDHQIRLLIEAEEAKSNRD
jgi:hypothetical protein